MSEGDLPADNENLRTLVGVGMPDDDTSPPEADPTPNPGPPTPAPDDQRRSALRWTLGGVATVLALALAGFSLLRDVTNYTVESPARTELEIVQPWDFDDLKPDLRGASGNRAECITGYISSDPESVKCVSDEGIVYDTCWLNMSRDTAACMLDPWQKDVALLSPINLDASGDRDDELLSLQPTTPWALQLANDRRCVLISGATDTIAGMRLNYVCDDNSWVVGDLDQQDLVWRAFFSTNGVAGVTQVDVIRAWA